MTATLGWKRRTWNTSIECVTCPARVTTGITHHSDAGDPPVRAMCVDCHARLMAEPETFEDRPTIPQPEPPGLAELAAQAPRPRSRYLAFQKSKRRRAHRHGRL